MSATPSFTVSPAPFDDHRYGEKADNRAKRKQQIGVDPKVRKNVDNKVPELSDRRLALPRGSRDCIAGAEAACRAAALPGFTG